MDKNMNSKVTADSLVEGASRALEKLLAKYYSNHGLGYQTYYIQISIIQAYCQS